jgi:hypothetical protein
MPTVITAFDAPRDADLERLQVAATRDRVVYRSVNDAAAFGVITLSRHTDLDEAVRVARADATGSPAALAGVYSEHDIGGPRADRSSANDDVVTFINCLGVEAGREAAAFATWHRVNDYMVAKAGYLSHVLYRRLRPDASFAFVNVVRWACAESLRAAQDDRFRELTRNLPFVAHPSLCRQVGELTVAGVR